MAFPGDRDIEPVIDPRTSAMWSAVGFTILYLVLGIPAVLLGSIIFLALAAPSFQFLIAVTLLTYVSAVLLIPISIPLMWVFYFLRKYKQAMFWGRLPVVLGFGCFVVGLGAQIIIFLLSIMFSIVDKFRF